MAATTISGYSTELNQTSPGNPQLYAPVKANQHRGKVRMSSFSLTLASQASATSFAVAKIPRGARVMSGLIVASATLANSATIAVGIAAQDGTGLIDDGTAVSPAMAAATGTALSDSTTAFKAAAVLSTTQVPFCITQALGYLYETQKDLFLTLTTGVGAVTTEVITGHILYVVE